jgi:hypothetical protein
MSAVNITDEIFKPMQNFEKYEISSYGNIRRYGRNLKPIKQGSNLTLKLSDKGKRYNISIPKMVAKHFMENYKETSHVFHKDGNKENNNVNNLYQLFNPI